MTFFLSVLYNLPFVCDVSHCIGERLDAYDDKDVIATFVVSDELRKDIVVKMN